MGRRRGYSRSIQASARVSFRLKAELCEAQGATSGNQYPRHQVPEESMANEIALNCLLNMGTVPVSSEPRLLYLLIDVRPGTGATPLQAPVNIAVVIDVSESMR